MYMSNTCYMIDNNKFRCGSDLNLFFVNPSNRDKIRHFTGQDSSPEVEMTF